MAKTLADPGGRHGAPPPPNRINFFCFRIRFCRKVYASEVGTPSTGQRPPTGNPGSATGKDTTDIQHLVTYIITARQSDKKQDPFVGVCASVCFSGKLMTVVNLNFL